jgi:hypothetical protein
MLWMMREKRRGVPGLLQDQRVDHDPTDNPNAGKPRNKRSNTPFQKASLAFGRAL